jgi:ubiquinone/menaquinone biosynthesis C-methylase UbiE
MGLYSRWVFPRLCDWVMRQPRLDELRRALLSGVDGEVLEIGFGSGLNLPHYPEGVKKITAIDSNPGMSAVAQNRLKSSPIVVDHRVLSAEGIPLADATFDSVVSSWTLCSIPDVDRALKEIYRLLKPGGKFFFLEHGRSEEAKVQKWQDRLTPLNKRLADGCHLNRDMKGIIERSGLRMIELDRFYLERGPKIFSYFYRGRAVKPLFVTAPAEGPALV